MWIEAECAHKKFVNSASLDTLYVNYKGGGNWAVCGCASGMDVAIKTCANESIANTFLTQLVTQIKNEK